MLSRIVSGNRLGIGEASWLKDITGSFGEEESCGFDNSLWGCPSGPLSTGGDTFSEILADIENLSDVLLKFAEPEGLGSSAGAFAGPEVTKRALAALQTSDTERLVNVRSECSSDDAACEVCESATAMVSGWRPKPSLLSTGELKQSVSFLFTQHSLCE